MAIGVKAWRPRPAHPPLRHIFLSKESLSDGIEEHEIDGVKVKVFSAARTVVDCFRFRNKIGVDVAVEALREYRRVYPQGLDAVWRFAKKGRMTKVMTPYLQAIG
jgi:predicted transcriptional regulator of viral defense system